MCNLTANYCLRTFIFICSAVHQQKDLEAACIWNAPKRDVAFNGAGFVRQNGLEIAWETIGLVEANNINYAGFIIHFKQLACKHTTSIGFNRSIYSKHPEPLNQIFPETLPL